jgi:excisionase family DNA binding protein
MSGDLMTTGQAAKLLGSSRQQVVNLCERGDLPFVKVGRHRRVKRDDVEALLRPKQELTRDQLKSLWLHQAVAGSLVTDPDEVLSKAGENLDRLLRQHRNTMAEVWLKRWQDKIHEGVGAVLKVLTSEDPEAVELRQNSPFAGVLSQSQRQKVLESFKRSGWKRAA